MQSLQNQDDITLRLRILSDSSHQLWGSLSAQLTPEGLWLGKSEDTAVVKPGQCAATCRCGNEAAAHLFAFKPPT